jgi:hypothetical protein
VLRDCSPTSQHPARHTKAKTLVKTRMIMATEL